MLKNKTDISWGDDNMLYGYDNQLEFQKANIKVEYESTPIRHLAVQCPKCNNWFKGFDIIKDDCRYEHELLGSECECPKCGNKFRIDYKSHVEESGDFPEFYDKCLRQKTTWE